MSEHNPQPPLGRLPRLTDPRRYRGLYIIDFGDGICVGYVAAEVATLVASDEFPQMQVYRIYRAQPDGTLDLISVPADRFRRKTEEGMFFPREHETQARADFETLKTAAPGTFPCTARLQLAHLPDADMPYVTALIYAAECTDEVSRWLLEAAYEGGDTAEAGQQALTTYHQTNPQIIEEFAITPAPAEAPRSLKDLLAARKYAVQR